MHGLDYFCTINKRTLTEISSLLGISKSAPTNWKNGSKNFPIKYKLALYDLFKIPENKRYLLEVSDLSQLDKTEIELIFTQNILNQAKQTDDEDGLTQGVISKYEWDVSLLERQVKMLTLLTQLNENLHSSILYKDTFQKKIEMIEKLIEDLEEIEGGDYIRLPKGMSIKF